ncbi:acyl-CoA thioesterase [Polymorphum gilvum]|nr:thioesterase family protein [Polymorphum gilvum]
MTGFSDSLVGPRRVRHVRYHRELTLGTLVTVRSSIAFDGPHVITVVHEMHDASRGVLAATAIDGYTPGADSAKALRSRFKDVQQPMSDEATPRGLSASPATGRATLDGVLAAGAGIVYRATVLPRHLGPDGRADDAFALSCFTDSAPHLWERTPMTHAWLSQHGCGRVAVEMKLTWLSPVKVGEPVVVATGLTGCQNRTFSFRHHMYESRTARPVAVCDVVGLVMDLSARKAVDLPAGAREAISRIKMD